ETFPLEASISQIEVGGRKIFTVICRDVTEQVRAREELRLSEEKYRTLYENSTVGIYRTTPDGRILLANPALVKMLGYSSFEHLATRNLKETGFEPSYPRKDFLKVIEEYGEVKGLESAWRKLDGEVIHLRENARAVRDISGRTMYFDGVVEDITQRKESEVKIRRLNRVYAVLSDINQIIVRVRDKQRLFEEACRVAVEVGKFRFVWIGVVDERESILKPVAKAGEDEGFLAPVRVPIVPKTKEQAGPIFKVVSEGTPVVRNDIEHDGMTFPWQSEALKRGFRSSASFPLKNSNHVFGTINFYSTDTGFFDPQEVMLLEELSSDISYAVENIEVEGQRKSLQAQLIQAQKMESLGTLAGGIAHDFNNILGIIMGYSTYIDAKDQSPEKLSRSANAIRRAAERGAILVKQLLTFARKDEMKFESAQVNDVVTEVDGLLKEILPRTIKVVTDLEPKLPPLTADATQIQQGLLNICLNARDAMPAGGTITIMTRSLDREMSATKFPAMRPEESLAIIIKDTGIGMSEEIKRRIFDPFFTTKEVGKGTGLGLALVHSIITSQNGLVEVESEPGKGSTFTIYLSVQERGSEKVEQHDLLGYDTQGGSETVLVLEDEELLMDLITNVLSSKGYVVLAAQNGQEGIDVFIRRRSEIAVVIADLGLPGLSGEEALKRIRDADPDVKLIAASGFIEPRVRSGLMDIGVAHFVHKPYTPAEILKTLRDVLDNES
ncbi:MAG: PAS domain S-box protein, partial [Bacteroidetes bacterium]|nr:PAS domain S-box protein [Bacteroidota bacterium]